MHYFVLSTYHLSSSGGLSLQAGLFAIGCSGNCSRKAGHAASEGSVAVRAEVLGRNSWGSSGEYNLWGFLGALWAQDFPRT